MTSALAFLGVRDRARHSWLLSVSVAPVQAFIRESRTCRDLWMSSFLISELAFAAMDAVHRALRARLHPLPGPARQRPHGCLDAPVS